MLERARLAISGARIERPRYDLLSAVLGEKLIDLLVNGPTPRTWKTPPAGWLDDEGQKKATNKESNRAESWLVRCLLDRGYAPEEVAAIFLDHTLGVGVRARQSDRLSHVLAYGLQRPSKVVEVRVKGIEQPPTFDDSFVLLFEHAGPWRMEKRLRFREPDVLRFAFMSAGLQPPARFDSPDQMLQVAWLLQGHILRVTLRPRDNGSPQVTAFIPRLALPSYTAPLVTLPPWRPAFERTRIAIEQRALLVDCATWRRIWPGIEQDLKDKIALVETDEKKADLRRALDTAASLAARRVPPDATDRVELRGKLHMRSAGRLVARNEALNSLHRPLREAIVARLKHKLLYVDFSACHLRVRAALSQDPVLQGMFARGEDVYQFVGDHLFPGLAPKDRRRAGKAVVIGWTNGSGADRIVDNLRLAGLVVTKTAAQDMLDRVSATFPVFVEWHQDPRWSWPDIPGEQRPAVDGSFSGRLGRRVVFPPHRWLRSTSHDSHGSWAIKSTSLRYRIGEAVEADAMIVTLAKFEDVLGHLRAVPLLPEYDGLLIEAHEDDADAARGLLEDLMLDSLVAVCPGVVPMVKVIGPMDCWQQVVAVDADVDASPEEDQT